ncbi:3-deoxy-7-phosphoheptulonate synthase, partial [Mycobacteroides abscessus]
MEITGMTAPSLLLDTGRAVQQPVWENHVHLERVRSELSELPALVGADEIRTLRTLLSTVAQGRATIIQAGDCAEDPQESTPVHVARKVALLNILAGAMRMKTHRPVLRVGRIGGQYAKPRSKPTEMVGGVELASFRGHLVNGPQPHPVHRRANPDRMLAGYWAANRVMGHLGWRVPSSLSVIEPPVWTSHEALLLDYEVPQLRRDGENRMVLTSTHWPWIGDRTRHLDGPHVELFSRIANPVACKVGPSMTTEDLLALCEKLDPQRESGRLTLIARLGAAAVRSTLPELVAAVRDSGHPVIWLCDPLHANTVST